jgi:rRNA-processing protein FCF1
MSDVPNSFVIIDTNAVIQALNEKTKRQQIQQFLKGKKCQIIVCNEVFAELFEPKKPSVGRWQLQRSKMVKSLQVMHPFQTVVV